MQCQLILIALQLETYGRLHYPPFCQESRAILRRGEDVPPADLQAVPDQPGLAGSEAGAVLQGQRAFASLIRNTSSRAIVPQRRFFKSNDLYELFTLNDDISGKTETGSLFAEANTEITRYGRTCI
jgi:hypothetical protein